MDNLSSAYSLFKLAEKNRDLTADYLVKSNAPNAKELCTGKVHFDSVINELESKYRGNMTPSSEGVGSIIRNNTETIPVRKSTRELSIDLSQAHLMNLATVRLINHTFKQNRAVLDNFRPQ